MSTPQGPQRPISPDGRWEWDGSRWIPRQAPQAQVRPPGATTPGSRPPRKPRRTALIVVSSVVAGVLGMLVLIGIIGALTSPPPHPSGNVAGAGTATPSPATTPASTPTPKATPAPTPKPTPAPTPKPTPKPPPTPQTLLSVSGNGIQNTPSFDAPDHWRISYSFDCSSFGYAGNFQVYVQTEQGDPVAVPVNALAMSGNSSSDVYNSGNLHLEINSECNWTVTAVTVP